MYMVVVTAISLTSTSVTIRFCLNNAFKPHKHIAIISNGIHENGNTMHTEASTTTNNTNN